ncbi:hypothetical protein GCM10023149_33630 [Mucilaginibacter gynuensis]|uniref:HEPN domain-containing protein n=2 Tax=Mucilaginibacter gynuensis TaxID=1302236 RepID=A0ABP8GS71_9SPHI
MEHNVQDYVATHFHKGTITMLVHSKEAVEGAMTNGPGFFNKVYKDGVVLYALDGKLVPDFDIPEISPLLLLQLAEEHYSSRSTMAKGLFRSAQECLTNNNATAAIFLIHQVMEQTLVALVRVHIGYRADIHHLGRLLNLCKCFSDQPANLFPLHTKPERRLFQLLLDSYSGSRYSTDFHISIEDANALYRQVAQLLSLADKLCSRKLNELKLTAEAPAPLDFMPGLPASLHQ